jgi:nucleoside-diphosphate-sugar epimerase
MKTVLLTGVAGFVGSETAKLLLNEGFRVIGVDNMNDYYDIRLKQYRLDCLTHERFNFFKLDIENKNELKKIFSSFTFDAVINLAARAGVRYSMENPDVYMTTNG